MRRGAMPFGLKLPLFQLPLYCTVGTGKGNLGSSLRSMLSPTDWRGGSLHSRSDSFQSGRTVKPLRFWSGSRMTTAKSYPPACADSSATCGVAAFIPSSCTLCLASHPDCAPLRLRVEHAQVLKSLLAHTPSICCRPIPLICDGQGEPHRRPAASPA